MVFSRQRRLLVVSKGRKPIELTNEGRLQEALVNILDDNLPPEVEFFAVPNGGKRRPKEAAIMRRRGVKAGVPDIIFIFQKQAYGLELKWEKGDLNDAQRDLFPKLRNAGMRIEVARSIHEALERIGEMGIPIRKFESDRYAIQEVIREETKRRAA